MPSSTIAQSLKIYTRKISRGLSVPTREWLEELCFGILSGASFQIASIARSVKQEIRLKKITERLTYHLGKSDLRQTLLENNLNQVSCGLKKDSLIVLDPSTLEKPFSKKMENIGCVKMNAKNIFQKRKYKDKNQKKEVVPGYMTMNAVVVDKSNRSVSPIYSKVYSHVMKDKESYENHQIMTCVRKIMHSLGKRGIYVMDRASDRRYLLEFFLKAKLSFVFRFIGKRDVYLNEKDIKKLGLKKKLKKNGKVNLREMSERIELPYQGTVLKPHRHTGKMGFKKLKFNFIKVGLPLENKTYWITVVVSQFLNKKTKALFATTLEVKTHEDALKIIDAYQQRWLIEQGFNFMSNHFNLSDFRVQKFERIENLYTIAMLLMSYLSQIRELKLVSVRVLLLILSSAKALKFSSSFMYYQIGQGIRVLLQRQYPYGFFKPPPINTKQGMLFNGDLAYA